MSNFIDEPLKQYDLVYKDLFNQNTKDFFDGLIKKSNIDVEQNSKTCDEYYKCVSKSKGVEKKIKKFNALKVLLIIFASLISIISIAVFYSGDLAFLAIVIPIAVITITVIVILKSLNPKIKEYKGQNAILSENASNLKSVATSQVDSLIQTFDYGIPKKLIEKTFDNVKLDDYFNLERYFNLISGYSFLPELQENESTLNVVSGTFNECPFVYLTTLIQNMINKTYTGTLTIHWTTTERGSDGKMHVEHHTQVLTAHSTHPAPIYMIKNRLVFASDVAPDLSFSRVSSNIAGLSDKEIEKKIEKTGKKLDKKTEKSVKNASSFTAMSNTEFEVLFGAIDRNNEVDFRLLFTPLAQKNEVNSIRDKKYYGDDFSFVKDKKLNVISSEHSKGFDFSGSPRNYVDFDVREIERKFSEYNGRYFSNLYFDLTPIINIPLYQQTAPVTKVSKISYKKCGKTYNPYEVESLANVIEESFSPQNSKTKSILKTQVISSDDGKDLYNVYSYAFDSIPRVDYVPVAGGDGLVHSVPVPWEEFIPIASSSKFEVSRADDGGFYDVNERGFTARTIK